LEDQLLEEKAAIVAVNSFRLVLTLCGVWSDGPSLSSSRNLLISSFLSDQIRWSCKQYGRILDM